MLVPHVAQVGVLAWLSLGLLDRVAGQITSGYIPPDYWLFVVIFVAAPAALCIATVVGIIRWMRADLRWPLVLADLGTLVGAWSVLAILLIGSDLPYLLMILSPVCLLVAFTAGLLESERKRSRP
jgi:hypothetical protein